MKLLREIFKGNKVDVIEELSKGDSMTLSASFCKVGIKNLNGRVYPESVIKREIKRLNAKIKKDNSVLSSAGHPKEEMKISDVSHQIQAMWFDEETGEAKCTLEVLPTTSGKNTMAILKAGGSLGISMRGRGTVDEDGNIQNDYVLDGADICTNPSFGSVTRFSKKDVIGESLSLPDIEEDLTLDKEKDKANQKWQDEFMKKTRALYQSSREAGMKLNFKEFVEHFDEKLMSLLEDEK